MTKRMWGRIGLAGMLVATAALSGCVSSLFAGAPPETYDLAAPAVTPQLKRSSSAQLLVPDPAALKILDSQRIVVSDGQKVSYYPSAQWPDTLPRVVQARTIEAFEKTGRTKAIGRPGDGLSIDYQILLEIRKFEFAVTPQGRAAQIELSVRVMNDRTGKIVGQKTFDATVPVAQDSAPAAVAGLNAALEEVLVELVGWVSARV
ncbi:ABC-type transport auxiliary lipoprotein family protein [Prosthecomicrobium pneumaticum]|uniref:Cholesterol transport system auxiliary component n=1 Tax=Prosthecomicrobium pneumaticum TaxID=81895 RepID=A0A7W9FQP6_9HYPH|nr:cholesterol transport system auxiliary component [Prosthecomicrobium pneumaticum]